MYNKKIYSTVLLELPNFLDHVEINLKSFCMQYYRQIIDMIMCDKDT